jgi:O-antigen ligase
LLPPSVAQRLTSFVPFIGVRDVSTIEITDDNYASLERLAHWQSALDMWRDHPWLGVGFGNYEAAYAEYALPKWPLALGHAHNYYLNVAAEAGAIGLLAYLMLWGTALWQAWQTLRRTDDSYARALVLGALGMLVHVSIHNVVDNLWVHNIYIQVAIVLGLTQGSPLNETSRAHTSFQE